MKYLKKISYFQKKFFHLLVFFLYFQFFLFSLSVWYYPIYSLKNFAISFIPVIIFACLTMLLYGRLYRYTIKILFFIFSLLYLFLIYHTYLYRLPIANEGYFVIFDALHIQNISENIGWLKANFSISGLLLYFIAIFIFKKLAINTLCYDKKINIPIFFYLIPLSIFFLGIYRWGHPSEIFAKYPPSGIMIHYARYKEMLSSLAKIKEKTNTISISAKYEGTINPLYVIIIGESQSRHHMSLYGYYRKTTPNLQSISNIFSFNNVVSTSSTTTTSLINAMAISKNNKYYASIIDIFNSAGFQTELYSNQPTGGTYDNALGYIFSNINKKYYAIKYGQYAQPDGILLPEVKKSIKSRNKPTIIFIHLFGSHVDFIDRYPSDYNIFDSDPQYYNNNISITQKIHVNYRINTYDNATLYNDYIVSEIIRYVSMLDEYSYVLYFSDHGEENYDFRNYYGRGGDNSVIVYDVPMLLWASEKFIKNNIAIFQENFTSKQISLANLPHAILSLSRITTDLLEKQQDFFSSSFLIQRRLCDGKDYTTLPGYNKYTH